MITVTYEPVYDSNNVLVKNVLTVKFNGKYVNSLDYPPETELTQDDLDVYIANKLSGLLS